MGRRYAVFVTLRIPSEFCVFYEELSPFICFFRTLKHLVLFELHGISSEETVQTALVKCFKQDGVYKQSVSLHEGQFEDAARKGDLPLNESSTDNLRA